MNSRGSISVGERNHAPRERVSLFAHLRHCNIDIVMSMPTNPLVLAPSTHPPRPSQPICSLPLQFKLSEGALVQQCRSGLREADAGKVKTYIVLEGESHYSLHDLIASSDIYNPTRESKMQGSATKRRYDDLLADELTIHRWDGQVPSLRIDLQLPGYHDIQMLIILKRTATRAQLTLEVAQRVKTMIERLRDKVNSRENTPWNLAIRDVQNVHLMGLFGIPTDATGPSNERIFRYVADLSIDWRIPKESEKEVYKGAAGKRLQKLEEKMWHRKT